MSPPTQQVNNLHVLIRIALDIPRHVESDLLLQNVQTSHVYFGLSTAPMISLLQARSRFPYVLYDMSSPAQQQLLQSQHVVCRTFVQTWICLRVSHTRTMMLIFYVESRILLHCCVLYWHDIYYVHCLGQLLYFLLYPSSGTARVIPRPFLTRVCHHGPSRGFNFSTHS